MTLLQMSFSGAVLILAVAALRTLAVKRLPKKVFTCLWKVSILRLLLPFSIPSALSVYSLLDGSEPVRKMIADTPLRQMVPLAQAGEPFPAGQTPPSTPKDMGISFLFLVWAAGFALCLLYFTYAYLRALMEFHTSLPVRNDFTAEWRQVHPLRRRLEIRQSDRVAAPLTYGILRPVILLPHDTDFYCTEQTEYVLEHEYIHIRRFDSLLKLTATFALCLHWFNPFVWAMYLLFNRDIELSCDEALVRRRGERSRSAYALTLIDMEEKKSRLLPLCNNFSKNAIEERITAIMKTKKITMTISVLSLLLFTAVVLLFATSASAGGADNQKKLLSRLTNYLVSCDVMNEDMTTEDGRLVCWESKEGKEVALENTLCYAYDLRFSEDEAANGQMAGRLFGIYAISADGEIFYYYDQANDSWYAYDAPARLSYNLEKAGEYPTAAFIREASKDALVVDVFEYITDDDRERIAELGLAEDDLLDGYYFNNPEEERVCLTFDTDAVFTFIDWEGKYSGAWYPEYYTTKDKSIFLDYLESYGPEYRMPFFFKIEDGVIKGIFERPFM